MTEYPVASGTLPGYLAVPHGSGRWPGIVVVHDAFGLTDDIRRIADRLAGAGYLVLTPALFRGGSRLACVVRTFRALRRGEGAAVDDILAARDHLAADPRCTGRVGAVGFCMGGGFCLLLAPSGRFDAAAVNYGQWPADRSSLERSCPMVASYGARDTTLRGAAPALEEILERGGVAHDVKEYPGVGHAFMNDWRAPAPLRLLERIGHVEYSEPEAEDAFARILSFFGDHLR